MQQLNATWWSPQVGSIGAAAAPLAHIQVALQTLLSIKPTVLPGTCRSETRRGNASQLLADFRSERTVGVVSCIIFATGRNSCLFVDGSVAALDHTFLYGLSQFTETPLWRFVVSPGSRGFVVTHKEHDLRSVWLHGEGKWRDGRLGAYHWRWKTQTHRAHRIPLNR
jgi:hypothetical protein